MTDIEGFIGIDNTLAGVTYGDLLEALQKDLQLNPLTDLLYTKGLALTSQVPQTNQGLMWNGETWVPVSFLQLLSTQNLQFQYGEVTVAAAAGWQTVTVPLPVAYKVSLAAWHAIRPANVGTITSSEINPNGITLTEVLIDFDSTIAQNVSVWAFAVGN